MEKELNWNELVQELSSMLEEVHECVKVDVILGSDKKSIEIYPAKGTSGSAFHHTEEIVDFCRVKRLSNYASFDIRHDRMVCYMRIF